MFCPKCKTLMRQKGDKLVCPNDKCKGAKLEDQCLWKDGNYYGRIPYLRGQQIIQEQKRKGCKVFTGLNQIVIMSPSWKPKPPVFRPYYPGEIPDCIKSIDEFE